MKKYYFLAILMLLAIGFSTELKAQTITTVNRFDSCANLSATTTISAAGTNLSLIHFWGDGTSDTINLQNMQTIVGRWHSYSTVGNFTVRHVLLKNGTPIDTFTYTYNSYCSFIAITTYLDNNSNCIKDNNEPSVRANVAFEVDSAGTVIDTIAQFFGVLRYRGTPGVVYKFKAIYTPAGVSATCPSNATITVTAPPIHTAVVRSFGLQCGSTSQFDLGVSFIGRFRPVNVSSLHIYPYNLSCSPKNGVVTLYMSNKYKYKNAIPTPTSVSGNVLTWNVNNLSLTTGGYISVYMDTADTISINDTICNLVTITPITGDLNPANNTVNQCDEVRASWDPNDKSVIPSGNIAPGTKLTYTINFENLGNDTAFSIAVLDTLSDHLDANSFELISSSHSVSYIFAQNGINKNILRFDFEDIYLPDAASPSYNKGYVTYSINAKTALSPLTQIKNRAGIYFDINPVVLTNYAENQIASVGINTLRLDEHVTLYPNPVTDVLTISTIGSEYKSLNVYNNMGQVVVQQSINSDRTEVNMKQLPSGLYYIQLIGNDKTNTWKVEKL